MSTMETQTFWCNHVEETCEDQEYNEREKNGCVDQHPLSQGELDLSSFLIDAGMVMSGVVIGGGDKRKS